MILYGYDQQGWNALTDIQREKVRNWAYDAAWTQYGGSDVVGEPSVSGVLQARKEYPDITINVTGLPKDLRDARLALQKGNTEAYDEAYGRTFNYPHKIRERFLPNTSAAIFPEEENEAEQGVAEREAQQRQSDNLLSAAVSSRGTSYSGCDITPSITVGHQTFIIGNIATISYSIHRDVAPVRTLGRAYPKSYVSASRTVAGTLVFNVFDTHVLHEIRKAVITEQEASGPQSSPLTDQLPPFDVTILFQNEYGSVSYMRIYAVQITDEGQTHSINDIYTENVMQYVARDIDLMVKMGDAWTPQALAVSSVFGGFYNDELATPAYKLMNLKKLELDRINRQIADMTNDLYKFEQYSKANVTYTDMQMSSKYGYKDANGSWTALYALVESQRACLINDKARLESEVANITESLVQAPETRLGSSNSRLHDSPYAMQRKPM